MEQLLNYLEQTRITISSFEAGFFLFLMTLSLLTQSKRTGLAISFIFSYRLGWIFLNTYSVSATYFTFYKIFGTVCAVVILAMFARKEGE